MIGATLKRLLDERGSNVNELAREAGIPAQTLYSIIRRDSMKIDFDVLLRICRTLEVPVETFYEGEGPAMPDAAERGVLRRWRRLDEHGRSLAELVMDAELRRLETPEEPEDESEKIIPLYLTAAAAGFASPVVGEDYEDYSVPRSSSADCAVRVEGDSMEPYIPDGSVALVKRGDIIRDGDVGLFYADSGMVIKQYCQDYTGTVRLFSLNRRRKDADIIISADSSLPLFCFGRVLMDKDAPLPRD